MSEVSLQGKFNNGAKSAGSNADLQSTPIISDSLDAFFSAQTGCPQGPKLPTHMAHSSILDAEETCHAFPVQRLSSSGKRVSAISGSSGGCSQDAGSKPSRSPKTDEVCLLFSYIPCRLMQMSSLKLTCKVIRIFISQNLIPFRY